MAYNSERGKHEPLYMSFKPESRVPAEVVAARVPPTPRIRAGTHDRRRHEVALSAALTEGYLTVDEFGERITACLAARFRDELPPLVADLPDEVVGAHLRPATARVPARPTETWTRFTPPAVSPAVWGVGYAAFLVGVPLLFVSLFVSLFAALVGVLLGVAILLAAIWRWRRERAGRDDARGSFAASLPRHGPPINPRSTAKGDCHDL